MTNNSNQPTTAKYETGLPKQVVNQNGSVRDSANDITTQNVNKQMSLIGGKKYKKRKTYRKKINRRKTHKRKIHRKTHRTHKTHKTHRRNKKVFKGGNPNAQPIKPATIEPPIVPPTGVSSQSAGQQQNSYNELTKLSAGSMEQSKYDNPEK
jgi:vesicle coat complex subunit